ncbi:uncharacterized protein BDZ99DRAFT_514188 [Mytilinidion resinicola]|uniref:Uncharacterized protein n=1 Tax=Mytilinidion resinicola TaxID=574789 RepID=A0A6A6ZCN9_9PEZI|nr:uncharacterized protein BDZ99DRAFT_514188 [Mytilinidion resinicola]KAF2817967.1 hypothetical protein BDZ99DRAFT_514188 [Mytilinidion resinicola]
MNAEHKGVPAEPVWRVLDHRHASFISDYLEEPGKRAPLALRPRSQTIRRRNHFFDSPTPEHSTEPLPCGICTAGSPRQNRWHVSCDDGPVLASPEISLLRFSSYPLDATVRSASASTY